MRIATLTSKGQMTIPLEIRSLLGIQAGDKLAFIVGEEGRIMIEPLTHDIRELKGLLAKPSNVVSLQKMTSVIAKRGAGL